MGINHFGESWVYGVENVDPASVLRFWQRPLDITFAIDQLSKSDEMFNKPLNWQNILAVGHSSGAATALALIGMETQYDTAKRYCKTSSSASDKSCAYLKLLSPEDFPEKPKQASFKDSRIKQVVALDPALGHIANSASLNRLSIPVLIVASKQNDFLNYEAHAGYYARHIPEVTLEVLNNGEGHFVYLDECRHQYKAVGVSLCQDKDGIDRQTVHQYLAPQIFEFISKG